MGKGRWASALKGFVLPNWDALLVIAVAAVVVVLDVFGSPDDGLVSSAILAVLAVMAVALLRDRQGRRDLDAIRRLVADANKDRPFDVVWQKNVWDIQDRSTAKIVTTSQIRFTRNDIATLEHWSGGAGRLTRYEAKRRHSEEERWITAKKVHEFPIEGGTKAIFALDEDHCRGDMLEWCVERDSEEKFPGDRESVSLTGRTHADHSRVMKIIWPEDAPPSHVALRYQGRPARSLHPKSELGRCFVEEQISRLENGDKVEITWNW